MVIRNGERDNLLVNYIQAEMAMKKIRLEYESCIKELEDKLEFKTKEVVKHLRIYLKNPSFVEKFTTWGGHECTESELTAEAEEKVAEIIKERFEQEMNKWEAENKFIQCAHDSLMKRLKKYSDRLEFRIKAVEDVMMKETPLGDDQLLNTAGKVAIGLTSPIWFPVALVGGILSLPVLGGIAVKNLIKRATIKKQFKDDKKTYISKKSSEFLNEHVSEDSLRPFVIAKFDIVRINLVEMKQNFAKLIDADMLVLLQVMGQGLSLYNAVEHYTPINADCQIVRGELSIFTIKEVIPRCIYITDLQWSSDLIGSGTFSDVFKGSLKTTEGKRVDVAVKVCKHTLTEENAYDLLCEELILR